MMGDLTKNFSLYEFMKTDYVEVRKLNETQGEHPAIIRNIRFLCQTILQPVRDHFGRPMVITSGYRCPELNKVINPRSEFSQHVYGEAGDFRIPGVINAEIYDYIRSAKYCFGQLILEPTWIHVSIPKPYQVLNQAWVMP